MCPWFGPATHFFYRKQTMSDILLIQPPIRDFYATAKRTVPYGLACIAAALESRGFSVDILDAMATSRRRTLSWPSEMAFLHRYYGRADRSPFALFHHYRHFGHGFERIGRRAASSGAFLVGISSLFTAYSEEALKAAEAVKRHHPDSTVVLGGHHPTALPEAVMACPAVDFVIRGEGEIALPELARALKGDTAFRKVPGIVYRRNDGGLHMNPPAVVPSLDDPPLPAHGKIDHAFYGRGRGHGAVVVTSRGCPMRCTYCSLGARAPLPYRRRGLGPVLAEIEAAISEDGVRFIDFEDENLTLERPWFMALLSSIQARFGDLGLELRAMNGLFPPSLDREMVDAMQSAGFRSLNLSLGSTAQGRLRAFQRPDVRAAFDRALDWAEDAGLGAVGYVIAAAPDQSGDETLADLIYLAERRVLAGMSIFYPAPGSLDYQRCLARGLLPDHLSLMRGSALPLDHTTGRDEAATLLRLARILNFMKSIKDDGVPIPDPEPFKPEFSRGLTTGAGKRLLGWFLHDGRIRGVTPEGEVFEHGVDLRLTRAFLAGLARVELRGAGRGAASV
jgi:radical SAM superfamily enzyme YgiQ (UPF0313 family)